MSLSLLRIWFRVSREVGWGDGASGVTDRFGVSWDGCFGLIVSERLLEAPLETDATRASGFDVGVSKRDVAVRETAKSR